MAIAAATRVEASADTTEAENHLAMKHASHSAAKDRMRLLEDSTAPGANAKQRLFLQRFTSLLPGESDGRARMAMPGSGHGLLRNHS